MLLSCVEYQYELVTLNNEDRADSLYMRNIQSSPDEDSVRRMRRAYLRKEALGLWTSIKYAGSPAQGR